MRMRMQPQRRRPRQLLTQGLLQVKESLKLAQQTMVLVPVVVATGCCPAARTASQCTRSRARTAAKTTGTMIMTLHCTNFQARRQTSHCMTTETDSLWRRSEILQLRKRYVWLEAPMSPSSTQM